MRALRVCVMSCLGMQFQAALTASEWSSGLGIPHWVLPSKNSPTHCIITDFWKVHGPWIVFGERHVPFPNIISLSPCAPASPLHVAQGSTASLPVYSHILRSSMLSPSHHTPGFLTVSGAVTSLQTLSLTVVVCFLAFRPMQASQVVTVDTSPKSVKLFRISWQVVRQKLCLFIQ